MPGSITGQAAWRLLFSLALLVCVVVVSSVSLYRAAIEKAGRERANDLSTFYASRLAQQERDWELQTRDLRVRMEYSRLPEARDADLKLRAFLTVQGTDRRFHYLMIQDRAGNVRFRFGREKSDWIRSPLGEGAHYFLDGGARLYRVFEEPIWLGREGMGRLSVFFPVDNALLGQLAAPGVNLLVRYNGTAVASSAGLRALQDPGLEDVEQRVIPWNGQPADPVQLVVGAPIRVLFTPAELGFAASVIPVLDGLILWFTLGTWLMRQARRINALEHAVRDSSAAASREAMHAKLREAAAGRQDEIAAVAETLRRTAAERDEAERVSVALNGELTGRNAQLESVNAELESFIYSVSHDLRAPLRAIAGYSAIIEEDYRDRLDKEGKDYLGRISASAESMARRIDDLLYLSRISRQELQRSEVDLSAMAAGIVRELREANPERKVDVVIGERIVAFADPRLMSVALANLIANAWKFTQRTSGARIEFGGEVRDGERRYWVQDNGAGFDRTLARKLFMPFQRLHSEREFEGTGVGLAIVERVIQRHGGRIWGEGEVDKGALFQFTL